MATRWNSKHTGQKIDDTIDYVTNPNLLDNWYFGNLIDQRNGWIIPPGLTTYSDTSLSTVYGTTTSYRQVVDIASNYVSFLTTDGKLKYVAPGSEMRGYTGAVYGPDRWKHGNNPTSILLVKDDALVVKIIANYSSSSARTLNQIVDNISQLLGKTVTASFLVDDVNCSEFMVGYRADIGSNVLSKYIRVTTPGIYSVTFQVPDGTKELLVNVITDGSTNIDDYISIKAIKLELGSQQTLAHKDSDGNWVLNEIPNYGEQLRRCQRYQIRVGYNYTSNYTVNLTTGFALYTNSIRALLPIPVSMRANPSIVFFGDDSLSQVYVKGNGTVITPTAIQSRAQNNGIVLILTVSGAVANEVYAIQQNSARGLLLDANL